MAKTSISKLSRREGYALHPKAHKTLMRRTSIPGQNANSRPRVNTGQFNIQLREKQKVKRLYGLLEKQFSNLMVEASKSQGQSGIELLKLLELRADNVVYRSGLARSRQGARQLVTHGHFMLNGQKIDIPSIRLKSGDILEVKDKSKKSGYFTKLDEVSPMPEKSVPAWINADRKKLSIKVLSVPTREDAEPDINEQLIVEYYSR